jgi:hypothetical protein
MDYIEVIGALFSSFTLKKSDRFPYKNNRPKSVPLYQ